MPAPIPTLGYPSRTAAAEALLSQGIGTDEIATRIGITEKQVMDLLDSADRQRAEKIRRSAGVLARDFDVIQHLAMTARCDQEALEAALRRIAHNWPRA